MIIAAREKASVQIDLVAHVYIHNILCIMYIYRYTSPPPSRGPVKDAPADRRRTLCPAILYNNNIYAVYI